MLYAFCGSDIDKNETKFKKLASSLMAKKQGVTVFRMDDENFETRSLEDILDGTSLFEAKYLVLLKKISNHPEGKVWLEENISKLAESEHIVLLLEGDLNKKLLNKIEKKAEKLQLTDKVKTKEDKFNIFSLADAFGDRDRKKLWVLYQTALQSNVVVEEIFWRLTGQVKNMLMVAQTPNREDLDLHPYVIQKTTRAINNFSVSELKTLSQKLLDIYYDARHGRREMETSLEKLILEL